MGQEISTTTSVKEPDLSVDVKSIASEDEEVSIDQLVDSFANKTPLGDTRPKVKEMIDKLDPHGYNLLHRAIIAGNKELVEQFISYDANLNALTNFNRTPLELALRHKHNEIAIMLWDELKIKPSPRPEPLILAKSLSILDSLKLIWLKLMS